jgi:hypothetical protein
MSEAQEKLTKVKQLIEKLEVELKETRALLRGEKIV